MRFGFLVAAVAAGGLLTGTAVQTLLSQPSQTVADAQAPDGATTKISSFSLADLNPLRLIYDVVMKQATSGANSTSFAVGTPVPQVDWSKIPAMNSQFSTEFSTANMARINGDNFANQTREFNDRMQDMRNYANNPAGWHGMPPH